jgi:hypothetical protein
MERDLLQLLLVYDSKDNLTLCKKEVALLLIFT